jgi:hypothetical protein
MRVGARLGDLLKLAAAGSIWPDYMPSHPDDPGGFQAFAFGHGYIRALIQAVNGGVQAAYEQFENLTSFFWLAFLPGATTLRKNRVRHSTST